MLVNLNIFQRKFLRELVFSLTLLCENLCAFSRNFVRRILRGFFFLFLALKDCDEKKFHIGILLSKKIAKINYRDQIYIRQFFRNRLFFKDKRKFIKSNSLTLFVYRGGGALHKILWSGEFIKTMTANHVSAIIEPKKYRYIIILKFSNGFFKLNSY